MNTELKVTSNLNGLARRLVGSNILDEASAENACVQSRPIRKTRHCWPG